MHKYNAILWKPNKRFLFKLPKKTEKKQTAEYQKNIWTFEKKFLVTSFEPTITDRGIN